MALAHIRNGQIIQRYSGERGWVKLEDGSMVSPPVAGYVNGNDKIVPIVRETVNTVTPGGVPHYTTSETVDADRVLELREIRNKTTEELEAEAASATESLTEVDEVAVAMAVATVRLVLAARDGLLANRTEAQILGRYKAEILDVVRNRRGLS